MDRLLSTVDLGQWPLHWRWLVLFPVLLLVLGIIKKLGVEEEQWRKYGIKPWLVKLIVFCPVALLLIYLGVITLPNTSIYSIATELVIFGEHHIVEMLTAAFAFLTGVLGLALAWRVRKKDEGLLTVGYYVFFSVVMLWIAGEEVAWGQWIVGTQTFPTPSWLEEVNQQGELTLHNLGSQQHLVAHLFRVSFGLGGLLGACLSLLPRFRRVAVPLILLPWFAVIAALNLSATFFNLSATFLQDPFIPDLVGFPEVTELMIGIAGFLYVWLNSRNIPSIG